jgi:hypothetical protein
MKEALLRGDFALLAETLREGWLQKRAMASRHQQCPHRGGAGGGDAAPAPMPARSRARAAAAS